MQKENEKQINNYPLSGFSKISYNELLGIIDILNTYTKLSAEHKDIINLVMDGMKYREAKNDS